MLATVESTPIIYFSPYHFTDTTLANKVAQPLIAARLASIIKSICFLKSIILLLNSSSKISQLKVAPRR